MEYETTFMTGAEHTVCMYVCMYVYMYVCMHVRYAHALYFYVLCMYV